VIRRRDQVRLSVQKIGLRKKRAAFAIVSVALGVIVVVTVNSLMKGVRDMVVNTTWTEEIDKDVIKMYARENPYDYALSEEENKQKAKKRFRFLTESDFETMRGWSDVEAADHPVTVQTLSIDAFASRPRPVTQVRGVPETMLRRYVSNPALLAACSNAIPLVIGERNVRLRMNEKTKKLELAPVVEHEAWMGREVTITLGDNYASLPRFRFDYPKREFRAVDEQDLAAQREALERNYRSLYDGTIFSTTLPLKARVVGICPGNEVLMPLDAAVLCEKWIRQRNQLAALRPMRETDEAVYGSQGRQTPRAGEFSEGVVLVKQGANIEAVAKKIDELGFYAATRARTFENQARAFDNGLRVVKKIAFAFGAIILGLACGLMWSTTSKIVSDSRADIGLFRALGATKRDIRRLFLGESVLLGVLGTLTGLLLGWALAAGISRWVIGFARKAAFDPEEALLIPDSIFSYNLQFCFLLLAGAAIVSLLAGLLPANRAANVDPVKALKRE
jgi:ABC-type lipoprotein release transport system permease subunit